MLTKLSEAEAWGNALLPPLIVRSNCSLDHARSLGTPRIHRTTQGVASAPGSNVARTKATKVQFIILATQYGGEWQVWVKPGPLFNCSYVSFRRVRTWPARA